MWIQGPFCDSRERWGGCQGAEGLSIISPSKVPHSRIAYNNYRSDDPPDPEKRPPGHRAADVVPGWGKFIPCLLASNRWQAQRS
jgi:hypothetical protein